MTTTNTTTVPKPQPSRLWFFLSLIMLAAISVAFAISVGSDGLRPTLLLELVTGELSDRDAMLINGLRGPRALSAFAVGGLLALAGVLMQVLLRNPLADPYILGTSGGAATAALLAIVSGLGGLAVDLAAFGGATFATLLVFGIAHRGKNWSPPMLLLTGVVLASGFGALVSLLLALSPERALRGMVFWLMGDFSFAFEPWPAVAVLVIASILTMAFARHLNVLGQSELQARLLGMAVVPVRMIVLLAASLVTAFAVTQAGSIGFIGLVVPHLMRRFTGADHRPLIPAAVLGGGSLLVFADTLSRTIVAPLQLPVGTLTAAIGVPLFLYLLQRDRHRGSH